MALHAAAKMTLLTFKSALLIRAWGMRFHPLVGKQDRKSRWRTSQRALYIKWMMAPYKSIHECMNALLNFPVLSDREEERDSERERERERERGE